MKSPAFKPELWLVDLDCCATALFACETACPRLSADEIERLQSIKAPQTERLRRAAYIVQRLVLERLFGPDLRQRPLSRDSAGRPHLPSSHTGSISLAHTGNLALIAATPASRIGVDLEMPREVRMTTARRNIIESAAASLSPQPLPLDPDARFLQAWVRLESLAKADGRGIGHVLTRIGAVGQPRGSSNTALLTSAREIATVSDLQIYDLDAGPNLYAAVAAQSVTRPPIAHFPAATNDIAIFLRT